MTRLTAAQVRAALRREARAAGSQKALAKRIGVSPPFLCDILNGRREPSGKPVAFLGLTREVRYVRPPDPTTSPL